MVIGVMALLKRNKSSGKTQSKNKRRFFVGGGRRFSDLQLWQKLLIVILMAGIVSVTSIFVYSKSKEFGLIAKAASYTKVDIRSNPRSSAGVSFHACKALKGDTYTVTIIATKPKNVSNAIAYVKTYKKRGSSQYYSTRSEGRSWWGNEVTAMQVKLSKSAGDELIFTAKSSSGKSAPSQQIQPKRNQFRSKASYETALRRFRLATVNPSVFIDCEKAPKNPTAESACLKRSGKKTEISKLQKRSFREYQTSKNSVYDASKAYWDGSDVNGKPISWAITVDGEGPACWYGGKYTGAWDDRSRAITWSEHYHHAGAFTIRMPNFLVEAYRAHNQGDGIRMEQNASNFHIKDVYQSDIHDDCVENDFMHGGIVEGSLFEGCFAGFSAANYNEKRSGPNNVWTIKNNLLSLKPFHTMFKPEKYGSYGHAMLFKGWYYYDQGPQLVLENNVFMAERDAAIGKLGIPKKSKIKSCKNNTFVWLGKGPFPDKLPSCIKVTTDKSVWTKAVEKWKAEHPTIR